MGKLAKKKRGKMALDIVLMYTYIPNLSQSTNPAPSASSRRPTLDFPLDDPPVRPMMKGPVDRSQARPVGRSRLPNNRERIELELILHSS